MKSGCWFGWAPGAAIAAVDGVMGDGLVLVVVVVVVVGHVVRGTLCFDDEFSIFHVTEITLEFEVA